MARIARTQVAVKPDFNFEHCDGCQVVVPRGNVTNVQVDGKWKFLCARCKRQALKPAEEA